MSRPPIHILHLHSSFSLGGKEARAVRLMNAFGAAARHTIVSAMPDQLGARDAIAAGIRYEIAQNPPPLTGGPSVARYEAIAKYMRRFDLVLTYNWGAIDGVMAKRVFGKGTPPLVHHEDGFNSDEAVRLSRKRNFYRRFALPAAHALVVPSHALEDIARRVWKQPERRVHRISNGIPTMRYAAKPNPRAIPGFARRKGEVVIGTVAGLRAVKDLPLLVRAVGGVPGKVRLVIVGEGPERQAIADQVEGMFMEDQVVMPGFLHDPARFMGLFDIFALSSRSEQQPIVVMEAMAAGLPVVSPPVGDVPLMVSEANRPFLTADRYEVTLRDRMKWLAESAEQRAYVGHQNQVRARTEFDESAMIAAYRALYEGAMRRPGALAG
ncbi:glycosyltransferase [Sphingomonas donggukensis]|uniref:Glycosyltransferase n=1 Tax=Sphingomonas donggukensis TaxID=2949093 RepID=A0ABY4TV65_9SPHN|nr:glycosyltransferase [Sphingomonas donggukensis]URW76283.1 glycosyltransferase [Sphingomonas donggukensis]